MKITIDTKEDSRAQIKEVIRMLSSIVGSNVVSNAELPDIKAEEQGSSNAFESGAVVAGSEDMFSIFQDKQDNKKEKEKSGKDEYGLDDDDEDLDIDIPGL